jgi:asparagine synthase (glutamine-hydrolysing)
MCGVAGYFAPRGLDPEAGRLALERMAAALHHRGPDDRGIFVDPRCGLASTRLSILDVQGGHMPMLSADGRIALSYNGEIYDHRARRTELEAAGRVFRTRSDTEVVLASYEAYGADFLAKLSGMFAFALFDGRRGSLLLARDRFGMKPLFLARSEAQMVVFASEAKAIFASGFVAARLDPVGLRDVFSAGYPCPPRSVFSGVEQLPPASSLFLEADGSERRARYWTMPYPELGGRKKSRALQSAAADLRGLFDDVVRDHLVADVAVGSYLSGGLDSTAVAARAAQLLAPSRLHTYAMCFGGADRRYDESEYSTLAAEQIHSEHRQLELTGIGADDYRGTIRAMEAPQVHTVGFCLYRLSRLVRDSGQKVVLSGEGSDELFAGYSVFRLSKLRRWTGGWLLPLRAWLMRRVLGRRQPAIAREMAGWWRAEQGLATRLGLVPPWVEQWWLLATAIRTMLRPEAARILAAEPPLPELAPEPRELAADPLHRELLFEQRTRLDGWVLPLGDRLTMAHSVEGRVPFLDPRIAELTARVPPSFLLRRGTEKRLLREAMANALPPALVQRKKRAFVAPISRWLFGAEPPEFVREGLSPAALGATGLFEPDAVGKALARVQGGGRDLETLRAAWALNVVLGTVTLAREFGAALA